MSGEAAWETLLAEEDLSHLREKAYQFEARQEAGFVNVIIRNFRLSAKYALSKTDLLLRLPPNFPMAKPDMFWTFPHVRLAGGSFPPQADVLDVILEGRQWQRWSRHLADTQWRPGRDNLRVFLGIIRQELQEGC
jgi:hypothetical protein